MDLDDVIRGCCCDRGDGIREVARSIEAYGDGGRLPVCRECAERQCGNSETIREVVHRVMPCFQIEEPCLNQSMTRDTCFTSGKSNNLELIWSLFRVDLEFGWLQARFRPPSIERNSLF